MLAKIKRLPRNIIARQIGLTPPTNDVSVEKDIAIPMSDDIVLYGNHYSPKGSGDFPTVLIRSPWGRGIKRAPFSLLYGYVAQRFAERGYHVLLQDFRPATAIPSTHTMPLESEAGDGRDTIQWLAKQPWFNGKLGLWGASILGYAQWAALAGELPPLDAIAMVPATTSTRWFSMFHPNDALALDTLFRLQYTSAVVAYSLPKLLAAMQKQEQVMAQCLNRLPIGEAILELPKTAGFDYEQIMKMDDLSDPGWQKIDLRNRLKDNPARVHLIAGWHDIFLPEQLEDYQALKQAGKAPHLTIGPWHHLDQELGSHTIRAALTWFDAHLKDGTLTDPPVSIFIQGTDSWRALDEWPPQTTEKPFYFRQQNELSLALPTYGEATDQYHYDPMDPTPSIGGAVINAKPGQQDNQEIEARADVITYETEPLSEDIEIMGVCVATLFVTSTLTHTDFFVRLCDAQEDGRSLNVTDNLVRLENAHEDLTTKQKIEVQLWPTAYRFSKGHRIRVQVASGAHPRWNRNLGTGEPVVSGESAKVAKQTIYHGTDYPSGLVLPLFTT